MTNENKPQKRKRWITTGDRESKQKKKGNHKTWHLPIEWLLFFRPGIVFFPIFPAAAGTAKPEPPEDADKVQHMDQELFVVVVVVVDAAAARSLFCRR